MKCFFNKRDTPQFVTLVSKRLPVISTIPLRSKRRVPSLYCTFIAAYTVHMLTDAIPRSE